MAVQPEQLHILTYPDLHLRRRARPIERVDQTVRAVADRMIELMHEAGGVGLAGPQVGLDWRIFVTGVTGEADDTRVYINPVLRDPTRRTEPYTEGCLSLPHITAEITRPVGITIEALDEHGQPVTRTAEGLEARVWQHEHDHLDGILIIDRMTPTDRMANQRSLRDLERATS